LKRFRYLVKFFRYYWEGKGVRQEYICSKSLGEDTLKCLFNILSLDPEKMSSVLDRKNIDAVRGADDPLHYGGMEKADVS
jgi:hypothetical protein